MSSTQQNGNTQLNNERESFNRKVSSLYILGRTKRVMWEKSRRNRTI